MNVLHGVEPFIRVQRAENEDEHRNVHASGSKSSGNCQTTSPRRLLGYCLSEETRTQGYAGTSVNISIEPFRIRHTWTNLIACGE
jgi:hypothetical protein